jgi:hypothetical protein
LAKDHRQRARDFACGFLVTNILERFTAHVLCRHQGGAVFLDEKTASAFSPKTNTGGKSL